jgi:1,2-diacylglycerol 3-beta-galactosyltransferase
MRLSLSSSFLLSLGTIASCLLFAQGFTPQPQIQNSFIPTITVPPVTSKLSSTRLYAKTSKQKGTIQILMSDTGGGHRASANALRDAFDELYPGQIEVDIVDIFTDYGPFFPFDSFVPIYKIMAEYSILWEIAFKSGETPLGLWLNEVILELFCFEPFKKCMTRPSGSSGKRADMVVSVHPLTQDIPLKILNDVDSNGTSRNEGRVTPFATVVTDLAGAYPAWFNPKVDKCFVPSDVLNQAARKRGLTSEQLVQYGLPIRKGFWAMNPSPMAKASNTGNFFDDLFAAFGGGKKSVESTNQKTASNSLKTTLQGKLGMKEGLPTVLIVGGGDGMGGIIQQAKAMGDKLSKKASEDGREYQMVVVCGNNKKAQETLSANEWGEGVAVTVNGFVNNMDEWMRSSDVIVTKAGPGTIAEASICGLPCMLSSFL